MAVTVSDFQHCERGFCFKYTGDGVTTVLPSVTYPRFVRPGTPVTAYLDTSHVKHSSDRSGRTGLTVGIGTAASATVSQSGTSFTVTTGAAVGNGVSAQVECVFGSEDN